MPSTKTFKWIFSFHSRSRSQISPGYESLDYESLGYGYAGFSSFVYPAYVSTDDPYDASASHTSSIQFGHRPVPCSENSALASDLYEMEENKIKWFLWLFLEKKPENPQACRLLLTLNFPFFEYRSNWAKVKCAGKMNLFNARGNLSFSSEKTIAKGKCIILYNSEITFSPLRENCFIEGSTTVEEANKPEMDRPVQYLSNDLNKVLEEQLYGDIILAAEGRELLAYKGILAARSPVFAAMFETDMKEKRDNRVEIDDIPYDVLKELVRYMYTDQVPKLKEISTRLFVAADKYQLSTLKEICEDAACTTLTVSNVSLNLAYSAMHNGTKLKLAAIEFIRKNKQEVMKSEEWKNILRNYPVLLANSVMADLF